MAGFSRLSNSHIVTRAVDGNLTAVTAEPLFVAPRQMTLRSARVDDATAPTGTAETHTVLVDAVSAVVLSQATTVASDSDTSLNVTVPAGGRITVTTVVGGTSAGVDPVLTLELD